MTEITGAERVAQLYASLANPELSDDLARIYMKEYLDLTGTSSDNVDSIVFLARPPASDLDVLIERAVNLTLIVGVAVWFGFVIWAVADIYNKRRKYPMDPDDFLLDHLLDKERIVAMTSEQFNATIAEASALIAKEKVIDAYEIDEETGILVK